MPDDAFGPDIPAAHPASRRIFPVAPVLLLRKRAATHQPTIARIFLPRDFSRREKGGNLVALLTGPLSPRLAPLDSSVHAAWIVSHCTAIFNFGGTAYGSVIAPPRPIRFSFDFVAVRFLCRRFLARYC